MVSEPDNANDILTALGAVTVAYNDLDDAITLMMVGIMKIGFHSADIIKGSVELGRRVDMVMAFMRSEYSFLGNKEKADWAKTIGRRIYAVIDERNRLIHSKYYQSTPMDLTEDIAIGPTQNYSEYLRTQRFQGFKRQEREITFANLVNLFDEMKAIEREVKIFVRPLLMPKDAEDASGH